MHKNVVDMQDGHRNQNIRMVDVEKRFGDHSAVRNLNLEIADCELLVFLGPSGSGKSTALNLLAGLEIATAGDIYFGGERVTEMPTERRNISMVFQSNTLYPHKNVRANILFALQIAKVPTDVQQQRMRDITRLLGIERYLDRRIDQLSGGERQRVAIAKALVKRPKLFLLDEPFAALDALLRRELRGELVRIHRELETTMVFVTHDQEEALGIADRIAVMNKGELVQLGPALEIYSRPANTWVASFVGPHSINLLDVQVEGQDGAGLVRTVAGRLAVERTVFDPLRQELRSARAIVGVRPEFTSLSSTPSADALAAVVYSRQIFGSTALYQLKADPLDLRALVPVHQRFDIGQRVYARPLWDQCVWFDSDSKNLILASANDDADTDRKAARL